MIFDSLRAERMLIKHFSKTTNGTEITDLFLKNYKDIMDSKRTYKKMQQIFQKIGTAWEIILSCCEGFQKISKIDFVNKERKIYLELKNRHNTDNDLNLNKKIQNIHAFTV